MDATIISIDSRPNDGMIVTIRYKGITTDVLQTLIDARRGEIPVSITTYPIYSIECPRIEPGQDLLDVNIMIKEHD